MPPEPTDNHLNKVTSSLTPLKIMEKTREKCFHPHFPGKPWNFFIIPGKNRKT
jgi:hypothetical protein